MRDGGGVRHGGAMFTGIVEETGEVLALSRRDSSWRLRVSAQSALQGAARGDSIAVNGCCLTLVDFDSGSMSFDVLEETLRLTSLAAAGEGARVNLERSLAFGGKIGGHFVTGHVDGTGRIEVFEPKGNDLYLRIAAPAGKGRYLVAKGSIAIDGISLTVAEAEGDHFTVWLIPHTTEVTHLSTKRVGDAVNLEFDLLGKYVEKFSLALLAPRPAGAKA